MTEQNYNESHNYKYKYEKYKSKYLNLLAHAHTQEGGMIKEHTTDSGAGVILVEMYHDKKTGTRDYAIILFKNTLSHKYAEGGGTREKKEPIKETARRELKEESANTFRLSAAALNNRYAVRHHNYVGYFVFVQSPTGIQKNVYNNNLNVLKTSKAPRSFRETDAMTRVYISQLLKSGIMTQVGDIATLDVYGHKVTIWGRTKALIRHAVSQGIIDIRGRGVKVDIPTQTLKFNDDVRHRYSQSFLNGTQSYYV